MLFLLGAIAYNIRNIHSETLRSIYNTVLVY